MNHKSCEDHELEETLLKACVVNALDSAKLLGAKSIAIPAISTGQFKFPIVKCARFMIETVIEWALINDSN